MLIQTAIQQLSSVFELLVQIRDNDYTKPLATLKQSTIGKHVRHIVEFYECLLMTENSGNINYDARKRNHLLEENVKYTLDFITEVIDNLERVEHNRRLVLISEYGGKAISMESSLYREITYNIEHTVHHLAIIGMALPIHFEYIKLSENFGYAHSTIKYLQNQPVK